MVYLLLIFFPRISWLQVKAQLYGCDCYAYALLALGCVDIVMDFGLEVSLLLFVLWIFHSETKCIAGHSQLWQTLLHMEDFQKDIMAGFARGK